MKRAILLTTSSSAAIAAALATIALVLVASVNPAVAASSLVNGDFETGDLTGWTVDTTNGGTTSAVTSHNYLYIAPVETCGWGPCYTEATMPPKEGSYFAVLTSGDPQSEATRISQPFKASNGDKVSGWAFFYTQSWLPYDDKAQVVVKSTSGTTLATPFEESVSRVGSYGNSGWKYWEHTFSDVTGEGDFQIEARVGNAGAGYLLSSMGLDDVKTSIAGPDTTPPETYITSGPDGVTTSTSVTFGFSSNEQGSTFRCKLTRASASNVALSEVVEDWTDCTSPKSYSNLTSTYYTFKVQATDPAGNVDPTPESRFWTSDIPADTTAPSGSVSINDGASTTSSRSVTLTLSATDPSPGSGVTDMRISNTQSGLSSASWEAYSSSKAWTLTASKGTKTVYVQYRDAAGNRSAIVKDTITYKP
jgi:hypothetical protein